MTDTTNGAAPLPPGGMLLLQLLAGSFADLWFATICGCWSGMVLQCAASPLPAPTPAHSNGSRGAAAAARAAPPGGGRDTVGRAGGIQLQQQLGDGSIQAAAASKPSQHRVTSNCIKRSSKSAIIHLKQATPLPVQCNTKPLGKQQQDTLSQLNLFAI